MLSKPLLILIALIAISQTLFSQTELNGKSFVRLAPFPTGETSADLDEGDLDGDLKNDIIVANYGGNSISVFRNMSRPGNINLGPKLNLTTSAHVTCSAIADLNNDGKPEVIGGVEKSYIAIFENESTVGNLKFSTEIVIPTGIYVVGIEVVDFDADGYIDIAVINNNVHTVSIYSNMNRTGGFDFQLTKTINTNDASQGIVFAFINDDLKPDLIVTNFFAASLTIHINRSQPGYIYFDQPIDFATETGPHTLKAGDINGDNKTDLVIGNIHSSIFSIFKNTSTGDQVSFQERHNIVTGLNPIGIAIADFDSDQKADIATGNASDNNISVFLNVGTIDSFAFSSPVNYNNTLSPDNLMPMDVDSDGHYDIISANFNLQGSMSIFNNRIHGSPPVIPQIQSFTPTSGNIGTTVTIYGSGFSENILENQVYFGSIEAKIITAKENTLVVMVPAGAVYGTISVVRNNFIGYSNYPFHVTFAGGGGGVIYNIDFLSNEAELPGNNPRTVKFADVDGDNKNDILFTQQVGNKLSIYRNASTNGLIKYENRIDLETGPGPFDFTINDFNGDGKPDIAVTNFNSGLQSSVTLFKNNSSPGMVSFANAGTIPCGSGANGITSADFNFDGKTDLAVTAGNSGYNYFFKNTGTIDNIVFEPLQDIRNWHHSSKMVQGDIDGDGITDIVITNFGNQSVSVNISDGTEAGGIFSSTTDFMAGLHPSDVAIGDVDNDGKPDILVANYGSHTISVLRNISSVNNPAFENAIEIATGKNPTAIALGDLDGDGKLELIIATDLPGKVGVHKNLSTTGNIAFGEVAYYEVGPGPTDIVCGDIDGDGKTDLAITNGYSKVTILRNTFGEPTVQPSGSNPVYGAIVQESYYDSTVNTYNGQPYVQRHFDVTPVNNPNTATGTITLYFRQSDFDAFNLIPDDFPNLPMHPNDSIGISNLRVYQYHGTSSEGTPGTYSGTSVVIDPDDARVVWNAETEWWEVSFEVDGFSGFFVSSEGKGLIPAPGNSIDNKLHVFPNPAYGRVNVKHPVSKDAFIRIIDMRGNTMRVVSLKDGISQSEINLQGLSQGIYKMVWQNINSTYVRTLMVK